MEKEGLVPIRMHEIDRLKVIHEVLQGKLNKCQAAKVLSLCRRQVIRLCQRVVSEGNRGVIHRLRGQPSNYSLKPGILDKALVLIKAKYHDFGPYAEF